MILKQSAWHKIDTFRQLLEATPESVAGCKPDADVNVWSLKEILGHLVDSAANNHQRFIRLQASDLDNYPPYDQEFWATAQNVNTFDWNTLIRLWYSYNKLLLHIIENIPDDALQNSWKMRERRMTLQWLVKDYFRHLYHHMQQFEERKKVVERL